MSDSGAVKQCPYCAETIKAQAMVCRFCGRNVDRSGSSVKARVAKGILLLTVGTALLSGLKNCKLPELGSDLGVSLNLLPGGDGVSVTNDESASVYDCDITINSVFEAHSASLQPHRRVDFPWSQFSDSRGTRFNLLTTRPKTVVVLCAKPKIRTEAFTIGR